MKKTALTLPFFILLFVPALISNIYNLKPKVLDIKPVEPKQGEQQWVDSVMATLSTDEKIAQLFMIRAHSNKDSAHIKEVSNAIRTYNVGGLCMFQGGPDRQVRLINKWQGEAKTPLLVSVDGEWGLGMRLDSTMSFPRQMTLGAIQNDRLIYLMGVEIARQCTRTGIQMNFAPVLDINSNPANPVINTRSFGECRYNVTRKSYAYMKGMQDNHVIAVGKHFPGHGDTDTDSHHTLPVIRHSATRLDTLELYPFKELINKGMMSIMVAHLNIPAYFSDAAMASTLSKAVITDLLRTHLGFDGLIVTDALEMKGVSKNYAAGAIELAALKAGNDILLLPQDIPKGINEIKKALLTGDITEDIINERCRRVLTYKYRAGLSSYSPLNTENVYNDLNTPEAIKLKKELLAAAITVVKNDNTIPFNQVETRKTALLAIGDGKAVSFHENLKILQGSNLTIHKEHTQADADKIVKELSGYERVIVSIHNTSSLPQRKFGISQQSINLINRIAKQQRITLCIFANPYALSFFADTTNMDAILIGYQDDTDAHEATAAIITGKADALGKLPVTGSRFFPVGYGIFTGSEKFIDYATPASLGIDSSYIKRIDSLAVNGIKQGAYPGCQILFARDGKIFYHKSFGHHTYDSLIPVKNNDLYDIASVTKIAATAVALMKLYDEGRIDLTKSLSDYLPIPDSSNKANIKIYDILGHQARLRAWIPFYSKTLIKGQLNDTIYRKTFSPEFSLKVADSIFILNSYRDSIMKDISLSPLNKTKDYLYSDLGLYYLMAIVEKQTGLPFDSYLYEHFYKPLRMYNTLFNPREHMHKNNIVPSEIDTYFRRQVVQGYVNDQAAAMLGGVGGHAGLFSNAYDLAILLQMLLNEGTINGMEFIKPSTVQLFTKRHFTANKNNRRGLLFDKPLLNPDGTGPTCKDASQSSYGHSGFTGTYVWVDPEQKLIYIFLSNRTYPNPDNRKISTLNIRTDIHQTAYEALKNSKK